MILDAADFGHAQRRRRLFILATRDGLTVDLTPPAIRPVHAAAILDTDDGRPVTRRLYIAGQLEQITMDDVPHLVTYRRNAKARRADAHQLATITAGGNHHGLAVRRGGALHHRMLSNRECARAQGFPDSYRFAGTKKDVKKQIGNAVPVGIARWFGERLTTALAA